MDAPAWASAACSTVGFAAGPGSSPARPSRPTPTRSVGEPFASPARNGPAPRSAHPPSGLGAAPPIGAEGAACPDRPGTVGRRGSFELSSPRRRRLVRRTGRRSRLRPRSQGSDLEDLARGPDRSEVVERWRALAHETAFAEGESVFVGESGYTYSPIAPWLPDLVRGMPDRVWRSCSGRQPPRTHFHACVNALRIRLVHGWSSLSSRAARSIAC